MAHGFIWWIVVGLIAGWAAGKIMKGGGYGTIADIVLGIVGGIVGELQAPYRRQRLGAAGARHDLRIRAIPAQHSCEGGPDQPDPDQRHAVEPRVAHCAAMNSPRVAATLSISGPVPTVILRCSGSP